MINEEHIFHSIVPESSKGKVENLDNLKELLFSPSRHVMYHS